MGGMISQIDGPVRKSVAPTPPRYPNVIAPPTFGGTQQAGTSEPNLPDKPIALPGGTPTIPPTAQPIPPGELFAPPTGPQQTMFGGTSDALTAPYAQVGGYDFSKLSDPTHRGSGKYNNDVGLFSQALAALNYTPESGFTPSEATLTALTDWINAHGGNVTRQGDRMTFTKSLDANGNPYTIDVATDYNPAGGNGSFSFQDPRGNPDYDESTGQWRAPGTVNNAGAGGGAGGSDTSDAIDAAIAKMLASGKTEMGADLETHLMNLIRSGHAPELSGQLVRAREAEGGAMNSMLADARSQLADRGLVSEPGVPQGAEVGAISDLSDRLAQSFGKNVGDIEMHGMDLEHDTLKQALELATGMAGEDADRTLSAANIGNNRQVALGSLALQQLNSDRGWQQFLSEFGLKQTQVMEMLRQGRVDQVLKLIDIFDNQTNDSSQGHV